MSSPADLLRRLLAAQVPNDLISEILEMATHLAAIEPELETALSAIANERTRAAKRSQRYRLKNRVTSPSRHVTSPSRDGTTCAPVSSGKLNGNPTTHAALRAEKRSLA